MKTPDNSRVLVLGLARNVAHTLVDEFENLKNALTSFKQVNFLVLESDSEDRTIEVLESISRDNPSFHFITSGKMKNQIPNRIDRISFCRNKLLKSAQEYAEEVDYVVVADLDGVNSQLTRKAIESCWQRNDWDVCTANQTFNYYDIYALRHKTLSPNDCWDEYQKLRQAGIHPMKARQISVYSRQIHIPAESEWIDVDSSFGGLAVYRAHTYFSSEYASRNKDGSLICEHVEFHRRIKTGGGKIYINPNMINSHGIRKTSLRYKFLFFIKYVFSFTAPSLFARRFGQ